MKKQLLGTTALVAAGVLALSGSAFAQAQPAKVEPIKLSLGGFHDQRFYIFDVDDRAGNVQKVDFDMDSEIYFNGSTTLDNGLKFTIRIELEANNQTGASTLPNSTNNIDENFLSIESGFGTVQLGTTDDVKQKMGIRPVGAGFGATQGRTKSGANRTGSSTDGTIDTTAPDLFQSDAEKINYFTPRLFGNTASSGLQLGVSYTPSSAVNGNGADNTGIEQKSGKYNRGVSLGLNYTETFDQVAFTLGGGWMQWNTDQRDIPKAEAWTLGANVSYAGFTLGASWGGTNDGRNNAGCVSTTAATAGASCVSNTTTNIDGHAWDVGLAYAYNLGYPGRVSLVHLRGEQDNTIGLGDDEGEYFVFGNEWTIGPGVRWSTSIFKYDFNDEAPGNPGPSGATTGYGGSAYGLVTGIRLAF